MFLRKPSPLAPNASQSSTWALSISSIVFDSPYRRDNTSTSSSSAGSPVARELFAGRMPLSLDTCDVRSLAAPRPGAPRAGHARAMAQSPSGSSRHGSTISSMIARSTVRFIALLLPCRPQNSSTGESRDASWPLWSPQAGICSANRFCADYADRWWRYSATPELEWPSSDVKQQFVNSSLPYYGCQIWNGLIVPSHEFADGFDSLPFLVHLFCL
jgi:hypothetical protein